MIKFYSEVSRSFFLDKLVCKANFVNTLNIVVLLFKSCQDGFPRGKLLVFPKIAKMLFCH